MANAVYGLARNKWANGLINWGSDAIHIDAIDLADYTVSITTHEFHSTATVPTAARVATFGPLVGKTSALGVLDATDPTFPTVTGDQFEALILWKNTGSDATSPLLIFLDTNSVGGAISVTPNGGNVNVVFSASGIATL